MIHGEDVVLNVIVDIIKIAEITSVERKVTAECIVPFYVIDTAARSAKNTTSESNQ